MGEAQKDIRQLEMQVLACKKLAYKLFEQLGGESVPTQNYIYLAASSLELASEALDYAQTEPGLPLGEEKKKCE